jgi:hypothetical protein
MFAKNKVSQSLVDAVNSVVNEAEKVPTATGMKVYGSSYGNSQKARKDQLKTSVDDVKGPSEKNGKLSGGGLYLSKNDVKEELKGNQSKIDANHNGKIDGQDFKILRGKKKVKEDTFSGKLLNSLVESEEIQKAINEVMKKDASAGDWIHDFLHSDNPKFDGKSKAERKRMALGAYYSMRKRSRNESVEDYEINKNTSEPEDTPARKSIKAKSTEKIQKIDNLDVKYGKPNPFKCEEVELNEISKSEVDHHFDKWTTSDSAPNHNDAGDDNKIHKSALKYLKNTNEPKEKHEKIAMHIADKFHGSGIDEAAPKKMDDVMRGKQNLEPAKKGVVGTVKSDFKNFKNFLTGKKETNEAINPNNQTIDTLAGRSKKVPKEAKIDNAHNSVKVELKAEEVESLEEDRYLEKFLSSRGINPKFVDRNVKVAHAKSNVYKSWLKNHKDMLRNESNDVPFDKPYNTVKEPVTTDKSGAKHTPMSRAKDLARQALKKIKTETMMGTAGATSKSKK